jgi:aspartyl protease family protein
MSNIIALLFVLACGAAHAAGSVALIGVIGDKAAVVAVDGGDPKTIKVNDTWRGIKVLAVEKERATLEIDGKRRVLERGLHYRAEAQAPSGRQSVTLSADTRGHFIAEGLVNGGPVRFMVDTGATIIALPASDAQRLGLDYRKGKPVRLQTASGSTVAYAIHLDRVRLGAIELNNVECAVVEQGLSIALLGMSFLNRLEMKREGQFMTLTRLF